MSQIRPAVDVFRRAVADLDTVMRASEGWSDDQRVRLERARLTPLRGEANRFARALEDLEASLKTAQGLLDGS